MSNANATFNSTQQPLCSAIKTFPYWRTLTYALLIVLIIYLALHAGFRALGGEVSDFRAYYTAAQEMQAGRDPYQPNERPYVYPPLLAFLCTPLSSLPIETAALVYLPFLLMAALAAVTLAPRVMLDRLGFAPNPTVESQATLLTALLILDRLKSDLQMFQVNTLMLLLLTLGLYWLDRRPWLAGSALGMALNIKGQSIVILPYLLLRRRWSAAASMVAVAAGLALLPAATTGWNANLTNLKHLLTGLQTLRASHTESAAPTHLRGVTAGYSVSITSGVARMLQQRGLDEWLWPVVSLIAATVLAFIIVAYRRAGVPIVLWPDRDVQRQQPWRGLVAAEWGCLMLAALTFNPQTNSRHFVLTLLPMSLAITMLLVPVPKAARILMFAGLAVLFAGLTLPPGTHRITWLYYMRGNWFVKGGPSWLILVALGLFVLGALNFAKARRSAASAPGGGPTKH